MLQFDGDERSYFDVYTSKNGFAGVVSKQAKGCYRVHFNSNCTKSSARKFSTALDAVEFIYNRRVKKGWQV